MSLSIGLLSNVFNPWCKLLIVQIVEPQTKKHVCEKRWLWILPAPQDGVAGKFLGKLKTCYMSHERMKGNAESSASSSAKLTVQSQTSLSVCLKISLLKQDSHLLLFPVCLLRL